MKRSAGSVLLFIWRKKMEKKETNILQEFADRYAIDIFGIPEEYQGEDPEEETLISLSPEALEE
jgi:hypothetical protein